MHNTSTHGAPGASEWVMDSLKMNWNRNKLHCPLPFYLSAYIQAHFTQWILALWVRVIKIVVYLKAKWIIQSCNFYLTIFSFFAVNWHDSKYETLFEQNAFEETRKVEHWSRKICWGQQNRLWPFQESFGDLQKKRGFLFCFLLACFNGSFLQQAPYEWTL